MELSKEVQAAILGLQKEMEFHARLAGEAEARLRIIFETLGLEAVNIILQGVPKQPTSGGQNQ